MTSRSDRSRRAARAAGGRPAVIDADYLAHQREWSLATFGPGPRTAAVLDHVAKEVEEIRAAPADLSEWADLIILALDGAQRTGADLQAILEAVASKQAVNERRTWPDWRTAPPDRAIEHDRSGDRTGPDTSPAVA